jgi:hypothetical protein
MKDFQYRQFAVDNMRAEFGGSAKRTIPHTHWWRVEAGADFFGRHTAGCGRQVPPRQFSMAPTCPQCLQASQQERAEAERIARLLGIDEPEA